MRHRRLHGSAGGGPDPHRGPQAARVPRLRLGRDRPRRRRRRPVRREAGRQAGQPPDRDRRPDAPCRHRPRPHPLGDPRAPERPQRPSRTTTAPARSRSSTTGSSRTSASCATASRRAATADLRDRHRGDRPPRRGGVRRATWPRRSADALRQARGRVRHRRHAPRRGRPARRRPEGRAARRRPRRRRELPRLGRRGDPRPHRPDHLPRGGRRRRPPPVGRDDHRRRRRAPRAAGDDIDWSPEAAEKGGYEHFMLKEIHEQPESLASRSPAGSTRDDRIAVEELAGLERRRCAPITGSSSSPAAAPTTPSLDRGRRDPGLDRAAGPGQHRLRVPLRPAAARRADAGHRRHPVGRDRRHDRPDPPRPRARLPDHRGHQHRRLGDHPRGRRGPVPAGRPGDRGRRLEDVRHPGHDPRHPRRGDRQGPRDAARGRASWSSGAPCGRCRPRPPGRSRPPIGDAGPRPPLRQLARLHVRRPRRDLPGRARGRPQAQGGQLRPRRGLRRGRAQARPDLAARRRVPAGRGRDPLVGLRQAHQQRHGGPGPRRPGDRGRDRGRRGRSSATPTTSAGSPTRTRRSARSWRSSRSSCSPTTSRSPAARTSTSRATWPSRSRSSSGRCGRRPVRRARDPARPRPGRHDRARHRHHQGRPDPRPRSSASARASRGGS